jgi:WD40 repeat protein
VHWGAAAGPARKGAPPVLDLYGDPLPDGATARLGTARWRGGVRVTGLAFAPGGKVLASSGEAGFGVCLWDAATGRPLHRLTIPFLCEHAPAFAPDGKTLVVTGAFRGQANKVYVMDTATGKLLRRLEGPAGTSLDTVAFSSDGRIVAVGESGGAAPTVVLWDIITGTEVRRLEGHTGTIQSVAFSPDGKLLASGSDDRTVRLWDVAAGKEIGRLPEQGKAVVLVAFSPADGGKVLASVAQDGVLRLWDAATARELHRLKVDEGSIRTFAFSQDGKTLASAGVGGMVRLWDAATGKEICRWPVNATGYVSGVAFSSDGTVLATAGSWEHAIRLWDTATGKEIRPVAGHTGQVEWLRFAPDGKTLLSAGNDSKILEWDLSTGKECRQLVAGSLSPAEASHAAPSANRASTVTSALSPDHRILARANKYGGDDIVRLWDTASGKELHTLKGHTRPIMWLWFSPDARLLASEAWDGTLVWEVATGKELYYLPGNAGAAFSPDGRWLAAGGQDDRTIRLVEAATGKEVRRWESRQDDTWRILFSPDSRFLVSSGASGSGVSVWAVDTGQQMLSIGVQGYLDAVTFSASGRLLAAAVRQGRKLPNGEVEETSAIHVWEVLSGQEIRRIDVTQGGVWALAFAPDGRVLASGGMDSTIVLWDLTGGKSTPAALTAAELSGLWANLGGDARAADRALWTLVRAPKQSVPFLRDQLHPVAPADAKLVARLLADLESKTFAVRQTAAQALADLGEAAEPALRKALEGGPTLEVRQQLEKLLNQRAREMVRRFRAIETLEHIGTAEARQVLESLAKTAPQPQVAQAASAALQRLARRMP